MPRPYLGVKHYHVRLLPSQLARCRELSRLRSIGKGKTVSIGQSIRDAVDAGLARLEAIL